MINAERPLWQAKGVCATDPHASLTEFYADHPPLTKLRSMCNRCPVIQQCRDWADEVSPGHGFFAGQTVAERKRRLRGKAKL